MNIDFGRCSHCGRLRRIDTEYLRTVSVVCENCGSPMWKWPGKSYSISDRIWLVKTSVKAFVSWNKGAPFWEWPMILGVAIWTGLTPSREVPTDVE